MLLLTPANDVTADVEPRAAAELLAKAASGVRLVEVATPTNLESEIARLTAARRRGERAEPMFTYVEVGAREGLAEALAGLADDLAGSPWMAEKAREIALEAELVQAVGTARFRHLAARRFRSSAADDERAARWAELSPLTTDARELISDDETDPGSLVNALRKEIGARRLPYRVVVKAEMAPLSATGDGVVYVARDRRLRPRDVARTVCHEIDGHVIPAMARRAGGVVLRPAGAADDEEGRALAVEAAAGFLDRDRKKELGLRHVAASMAHAGADFEPIADVLERLAAKPEHAVRIAARALRGGGLGRERVYLAAYFRLQRPVTGRG